MKQTKLGSMPPLDTLVIEDAQAFASLEEEWEDLYSDSPLVTPFQSWAWLYSWWEFYGEGYELRLITVRDGDLLVGIMPLMLERRGGFGRLLFIGTGPTYYQDLLTRQGWEARVSEAVVQVLRQMNSWHVADLQELRPEAAAWHIFWEWDGPRTSTWQSDCSVIDAKPWDELLMSLSRNLRSTTRRTLRRAEADGVRCELAVADDTEQAARRLVALNREQWRERWRETGPEHWTRRFEAHLKAVARRMAARGLGGISEFRRDGEVFLSHFLVFAQNFIVVYLIGANREALQRYQFSSLFIRDGVNIARGRNSKRLDLGRGKDPYKLRWRSRVIPNHRVILGRNWISLSPYGGYHALRSRAKRYAYSEDVPRWIKSATDMYRSLKYRAARYVNSETTPWWIKSIASDWFKGV